MKYDDFTEIHPQFPVGRYRVDSFQLQSLLTHAQCKGVSVRVLHLGTMALDRNDMIKRLSSHAHPRLDKICITCMDGEVIIDEPHTH